MATNIEPTTFTFSIAAAAPSVKKIAEPGFRKQLRADLDDVFYEETEFAEPVTWVYADGTEQTVPAIFDEEHVAADVQTGAPLISSEPQITLPLHRLNAPAGQGDKVVIRNRRFDVKEILPDGTGVATVNLLRE
jgi:hypothetical protein